MLATLSPYKKYLIVVPLLSEVDRLIEQSEVDLYAPTSHDSSKTDSLAELIAVGKNVVTTHSLYSRLVDLQRKGSLDDYDIIIDEVLDVVHEAKLTRTTRDDIENLYIPNGLITIDPVDSRILPTQKWIDIAEKQRTLEDSFYKQAQSGCLFYVDRAFFVFAFPKELLVGGKSVTIYTFLAEGSVLVAYLNRLGIEYEHATDEEGLRTFKKHLFKNLTVETLHNIDNRVRFKYSYSWQRNTRNTPKFRTVATKLKHLYGRKLKPKGILKEHILLTCRKGLWYSGTQPNGVPIAGPFSDGTGLLKDVNWVANTTRGTNDYADCSVAIYLHNQFMNQALLRWLHIKDKRAFEDAYALTELIQWLYRTRIRRNQPVTLYMPAPRMREILKAFIGDRPQLSIVQNDS
jgi:hypothetical protein